MGLAGATSPVELAGRADRPPLHVVNVTGPQGMAGKERCAAQAQSDLLAHANAALEASAQAQSSAIDTLGIILQEDERHHAIAKATTPPARDGLPAESSKILKKGYILR